MVAESWCKGAHGRGSLLLFSPLSETASLPGPGIGDRVKLLHCFLRTCWHDIWIQTVGNSGAPLRALPRRRPSWPMPGSPAWDLAALSGRSRMGSSDRQLVSFGAER